MNYINYSIELQLIKHSVEKWDDFNMDLYVYVFRRYLETFKILAAATTATVAAATVPPLLQPRAQNKNLRVGGD